MKIVNFIWATHLATGICTAVINLAKAQRKQGNEVVIVNMKGLNLGVDDCIPAHSIKNISNFLKSFNPDIAVINGVCYIELYFLALILSAQNIPFLLAYHGAFSKVHYKSNYIKNFLFKHFILKPVIKKAKNAIFLSNEEIRNSCISDFTPTPLVLPNGCYLPPNIQIDKSLNAIVQISYIGRIDIFVKGIDILILAVKQLVNNGLSNFKISLYGPANEFTQNWLNRHIADLKDYISWEGPVFDVAKDAVLRHTDIGILLSRTEGFPVSILEFLSYGIPCIITTQTNMATIIENGKCGWVTNHHIENVANTLRQAISEYRDKLSEYRENSLNEAAKFAWDKIAHSAINAYKSQLTRR